MKKFEKINIFFQENFSLTKLLKILIIILIFYFLSITNHVWLKWIDELFVIILPFLIGFAFAYIFHPIIRQLETFKISKKITIPILCIVIICALSWLLMTLVPLLYDRIIGFINSLIGGISWLSNWYMEVSGNDPSPIINSITNEALSYLNDSKLWIPNITILLPQIVNNIMRIITNAVFSVIIAIYVLFDYDKIKRQIYHIAHFINDELPRYVHAVDQNLSVYVRALVILMIIKYVEYGILYFAIGHQDWLIIALLTSIGLLIPYFGATLANGIGILTALTLPTQNLVILIIGICVLSSVDAYIIAPFVHSKRSLVPPLWTLFSVFAGGMLLGPIGIMISIPVFMSCRVVLRLLMEKQSDKEVDEGAYKT